ncbi:VIT domain-containing protein [Vibrio breoganii]|uniref:VIT domain-containing protein n=1 Tax=Vibrio breoganii TaxID=553239 RepID=UPI000C820075|nr:VIT domain-containing protein [Vibrio breoganii]PMG96551.1 hypothetical protein BCU80_04255 [Vibrio breoganii]PMK50893.1 hypothetical protein BCT98_03140 [Vibrio breoganii]
MNNKPNNHNVLESADLSIDILFPFASTKLTQRFFNDSDDVIEAVYQFPMPKKAVLGDIETVINDVAYTGKILPSEKAEDDYEECIAEGKRCVLVKDIGDGLYEISLGNLASHEKASITLTIHNELQFNAGYAKYFLPTVITPRYGRVSIAESSTPSSNALANYPMSARVTSPVAIIGSSHPFSKNDQGEYELKGFLNRDISLTLDSSTTQAAAFTTQVGDKWKTIAHSSVINFDETESVGERALQILVDCSGSMGGVSIQHTKQGLEEALMDFSDNRAINIIKYGSTTDSLLPYPQKFGDVKQSINELCSELNADMGGTELLDALELALDQLGKSELSGDILLLTDGQIWRDGGRIDTCIARANQLGARIFCIGVGNSISEQVLLSLSEGTQASLTLVNPHENMADAITDTLLKANQSGYPLTVSLDKEQLTPDFLEQQSYVYDGQLGICYINSATRPEVIDFSINGQSYSTPVLPAASPKAVHQLVAKAEINKIEDDSNAEAVAIEAGILSRCTSFTMISDESVAGADGMPKHVAVPQMVVESHLAMPRMKRMQRSFASRQAMPTMVCKDYSIPWSTESEECLSFESATPAINFRGIEHVLDRRLHATEDYKKLLTYTSITLYGIACETGYEIDNAFEENVIVAAIILLEAKLEGYTFNKRVEKLLEKIASGCTVSKTTEDWF